MSDSEDLTEFAIGLKDQMIGDAEQEGDESFVAEAFTRYFVEVLTEAGEIDDADVCFHRARGVETSGWGISADGLALNLFITRYTQSVPPETIDRAEVETALRRLAGIAQRCFDGYFRELEEASPSFDMAQRIYALRNDIAALNLFLLTDGLTTIDAKSTGELVGRPVAYHIWDIRRLQRCVTSGQLQEPIEIDFESEFGEAIPCLSASHGGDYTAFLAVFPGRVLSAVYERYGARLLELNVRSFLQARGKVNQGIRSTILNEPNRFLAYNNGISTTASQVETTTMPGGGLGLRKVRDFQIVNGGQTTASLYQAVRRDKADLDHVFVQAKLTVVSPGDLGVFVPLVSRYANSQNKVNEADFSANDPFHVELEKLSRTVWAPAADGTQRQARWFYERARGQYQDALAREGTPARQRQWKSIHPSHQRFTKTDLAKFENSWAGSPQLVSLGAEKNFREFTLRPPKGVANPPDITYFHDLIAKAILFRRAEKIVSSQKFGGYRANIVTYSVAKLCQLTDRRIDLRSIWQRQDISSPVSAALIDISHLVHGVISDPPSGGNVTEWCKKDRCWERIQSAALTLPPALGAELLSTAEANAHREATNPALRDVAGVSSETWAELTKWISETGALDSSYRVAAYGLSRLTKQGRPLSLRQLEQGLAALQVAREAGFRPSAELQWEPLCNAWDAAADDALYDDSKLAALAGR